MLELICHSRRILHKTPNVPPNFPEFCCNSLYFTSINEWMCYELMQLKQRNFKKIQNSYASNQCFPVSAYLNANEFHENICLFPFALAQVVPWMFAYLLVIKYQLPKILMHFQNVILHMPQIFDINIYIAFNSFDFFRIV